VDTPSVGSRSPERAAGWLVVAGVLGPFLFVLLFTAAGLLRPGYSAVRQPVSDLGVGPNAWLRPPTSSSLAC